MTDKYYVDENNKVYASPSVIKPGWVEKTWGEVQLILNPPLTGEQILKKCIDNLADYRWTRQVAGIMIDGVLMQTDDSSIKKMASYITESIINGLIDVAWKLEDGSFKLYTVQELKPVYKHMVTYVGNCFKREMTLQIDLNGAVDPTSVDLTTDWPNVIYTT